MLLGALRPALLLAQAAATLDQISEGRFVLGLGAGFPFPETERQFQAVGVPYAGRVGRLTETIAALRLALAGGRGADQLLRPPPRALRGGAAARTAHAPAVRRCGSPARARRLSDESAGLPTAGCHTHRARSSTGRPCARTSAATEAGRETPRCPGLYATVALDGSPKRAQERLANYIQAYYGQPVELIAMIQAMYAGTPEGMLEWLAPYIQAGARHIVLRVADEDPQRGLKSAAKPAS